jgi:hypothetical protein
LKGHFYRVNFSNLKSFPHLAFPHFATPENSSKQLGFDGELMASFFPALVEVSPITGVKDDVTSTGSRCGTLAVAVGGYFEASFPRSSSQTKKPNAARVTGNSHHG